MNSANTCRCDGCGQEASDEHLTRRLRRLECATRFRPVHIGVLFLGSASPVAEAEFLYAGAGDGAEPGSQAAFQGEGKRLLSAAGLGPALEKNAGSRAAALAEFQRRGYFLTHVLECPADKGTLPGRPAADLLLRQLPAAITRIRRSLKPRRIVLVSESLDAIVPQMKTGALEAELWLDDGKAFALDGEAQAAARATARLEALLATAEVKP